jgi:hypothetical protein
LRSRRTPWEVLTIDAGCGRGCRPPGRFEQKRSTERSRRPSAGPRHDSRQALVGLWTASRAREAAQRRALMAMWPASRPDLHPALSVTDAAETASPLLRSRYDRPSDLTVFDTAAHPPAPVPPLEVRSRSLGEPLLETGSRCIPANLPLRRSLESDRVFHGVSSSPPCHGRSCLFASRGAFPSCFLFSTPSTQI